MKRASETEPNIAEKAQKIDTEQKSNEPEELDESIDYIKNLLNDGKGTIKLAVQHYADTIGITKPKHKPALEDVFEFDKESIAIDPSSGTVNFTFTPPKEYGKNLVMSGCGWMSFFSLLVDDDSETAMTIFQDKFSMMTREHKGYHSSLRIEEDNHVLLKLDVVSDKSVLAFKDRCSNSKYQLDVDTEKYTHGASFGFGNTPRKGIDLIKGCPTVDSSYRSVAESNAMHEIKEVKVQLTLEYVANCLSEYF